MISLIGPLDAAFARAKGLNFIVRSVLGLMSRKIMRLARKRDVNYSFLFMPPDGKQLEEIGELLKSERIRPLHGRLGVPADLAQASSRTL